MARINWRYLIILGFLSDMPNPQYHDIQFGNKVSYANTVFFKDPGIAIVNRFKFIGLELQGVGQ